MSNKLARLHRYVERAEEARTIAEQTINASARATMLDVADNYERMAKAVARLIGDTEH